MLRNIAKTGPYFHDGSVADLKEAVQVMADVQSGSRLLDDDAAAIVSFLDSHRSDSFQLPRARHEAVTALPSTADPDIVSRMKTCVHAAETDRVVPAINDTSAHDARRGATELLDHLGIDNK